MYRQILPALLVMFSLTSWVNAGLAASIQYTARPPMIASATVDADRRTLVVSGWHFSKRSAVVALGNRVLKVKSHSNSKLVVAAHGYLSRQLSFDDHRYGTLEAPLRAV
jgi:hypothetical protein